MEVPLHFCNLAALPTEQLGGRGGGRMDEGRAALSMALFMGILKDHGQDFLVGNQFSWADVHLLEAILMVEEKKSSVISEFPQLQVKACGVPQIAVEGGSFDSIPGTQEGQQTAAANVSSLPPLSQRLSQIRRRKKRKCDEMFSELMQSSGTEAECMEGHNRRVQESGR
ncbi:Glutathione S-transferase 3 [Chelonia mydas]|uniref:Glutathione S-transferase 3 n=1 Tax=Chelonia mydas TaxID=8469 RepID=M7BSQ9_CHEMY|nr:Glutathione S-transferase 3 [Chelonia mydas]